jgi:hypothetical protein
VRKLLAPSRCQPGERRARLVRALLRCWGAVTCPSSSDCSRREPTSFHTGRALRLPSKIALAAGRVDAARRLADVEGQAKSDNARTSRLQWIDRPYCKAFPSEALNPFVHEAEGSVVFIHRDFSVTRSYVHGADVVLDGRDERGKPFAANSSVFVSRTTTT